MAGPSWPEGGDVPRNCRERLAQVAKVQESKVSAEGRVSIPADIRHALGLQAGDRVQFVLDGATVRLVTARSLAESVWSHNTGGDACDAGEVIREVREAEEDRPGEREDQPLDPGPPDDDQDEFLAALFPAA
jgi:AbrB family looped-hinge helix DNA binding protein